MHFAHETQHSPLNRRIKAVLGESKWSSRGFEAQILNKKGLRSRSMYIEAEVSDLIHTEMVGCRFNESLRADGWC
jgi:hypothetical protein